MQYELRTMDGAKITVNQKERDAIVDSIKKKAPCIELSRTGDVITIASISGVYSKESIKKEQTTGRLHDGTKVIKQYGQWVDANNSSLFLDHKYYPELASDSVMDEQQWESKQDKKLLDK